MFTSSIRLLAAFACVATGVQAQQLSSGTGFFFSSSGHVATNYHVIQGQSSLAVRDFRGKILGAEVVATDQANDLAILKVEGSGFPHLSLRSSDQVRKGESVYALGFPNIAMQGLEAKITDGIVSSLSGLRGEPNSFQISVPIQPGNSGGPLIDKSGAVVGVVVAKLNPAATLKAGAGIPENVNFAVKSNYLLELMRTLRSLPKLESSPSSPTRADFPDIVDRVERATVLVIAASRIDKEGIQEGRGRYQIEGNGNSLSQSPGRKTRRAECSQNKECLSGECFSGRCTANGSLDAGEGCVSNRECSASLSCFNGTCRKASSATQYTAKMPLGASCFSNSDCESRNCPYGLCNPPPSGSLLAGDRCESSRECRDSMVCIGEVGNYRCSR